MGIQLREHQREAISKMKNGCILCGGVGSGKSRTALAYYYISHGGLIGDGETLTEPMSNPCPLYIITTARKRDTYEWELEYAPFMLRKVIVDSWNNIKKYTNVSGAFFIFDEQRVVGKGVWVNSFLKIAKNNEWILLSATPGDKWEDYIPVFIANGFYRSRREFNRDHIVFSPYTTFPKVDRYLNTGRLIRLRNKILVDMAFDRPTVTHNIDIYVDYDHMKYKELMKTRWDFWKNEPIESASGLCYCLRKIVNSDPSRQIKILEIFEDHPRLIIFYNYDYELEILKGMYWEDAEVAEWNGHKHQEIPESEKWVYLVQYNAGAEGWNCIKTDTIIFFSQNYSYKAMVQASGRIDRMNTPFVDLYFYHFKSRSGIDLAISKALKNKKKFNERKFANFN